jgi:hypothetical protein
VANDDDPAAPALEQLDDARRRLALARPGPHRADRDDRDRRPKHRRRGPEQRETRSGGQHKVRPIHYVLVRHVGVGEDDVGHAQVSDQLPKVLLGEYRDALGIEASGELRRVATAVNAGYLRRGERDDLPVRIIAVMNVEVVKIAPGGTHDEDPRSEHRHPPRRERHARRVRCRFGAAGIGGAATNHRPSRSRRP